MDVVAASYTPVDGGMRSLPGELGSLLLVAGERQAVAAAVGGMAEELATLLVLASCHRWVPTGVPGNAWLSFGGDHLYKLPQDQHCHEDPPHDR